MGQKEKFKVDVPGDICDSIEARGRETEVRGPRVVTGAGSGKRMGTQGDGILLATSKCGQVRLLGLQQPRFPNGPLLSLVTHSQDSR